jgi:hypothetical protein
MTADVVGDAVEFAQRVLCRDPFPHTRGALRSRRPIVAIVGGRRSAKSDTSQIKALHVAFTRRGAQVLIIGPNELSVRRYLAETAALLEGSDFGRGAVLDLEAMLIRLANGSELIGLPPTAGRARGYGGRVWLVVWDECGHGPAATMADLRYVLIDHVAEGAQLWLLGSPWGGDQHPFKVTWEQGVNGDPDVASYKWRTSENPLLPPGWLARERSRINAVEAAGELDGEWWADQSTFYPRALIDRATADIEMPDLAQLGGQARGIVSVDWGVSYDQSVAWVLYRLAGIKALNPDHDGRPVFVGWPYIYDPGTPLVDVVEAVVACPANFHTYAAETNGVGAMPSQELVRRVKDARPLRREQRWWAMRATTRQSKMASHGAKRWLLERDQIVLGRIPQQHRQFTGMKLDTSGRVGTIEAGDAATHDDIVDAAAAAMLPHIPEGQARVVCAVQEMAGERGVAEAPVEELDLPVVQTGGGLRVYARPVLQSVADQKVTVPAGAGPKQWRDPEFDAAREQVQAAINATSRSDDDD